MKNIVIIGSGSPLGKNLIDYIKKLSTKYRIHCYSRSKKNFDFKKKTLFQNIKKIEHLFYFASRTPEIKNKPSILKDNLTGTINLLNSLDCIKIKNFHFSSSTSIFSNQNKILNNQSLIDYDSEYGLSKFIICQILKDYCSKNKINLNIIHCPTIVGKNYKKNFLGKLFIKIQQNKKINIYGGKNYYNSICLDTQIFKYFFMKKNKLINESFIGSSLDLTFKDLYLILKSKGIKCSFENTSNNVPVIDLNNHANKTTGVYSSKLIIENFIKNSI